VPQIYCGKLPKDLFEDSLIPLFENIGAIWDLRLMMDPISGRNRGYCFVTFTEKKAAEEAVKQVCTPFIAVQRRRKRSGRPGGCRTNNLTN